MSDYQITLEVSQPNPDVFRGTDVFRLYARAQDPVGDGLVSEIFLYRRELVDSQSQEYREDFMGVCSPLDISAYPRNEPDPSQVPPFYRRNVVDILVPGLEMYAEARQSLVDQTQRLLGLLYNLNRLQSETVVVTRG